MCSVVALCFHGHFPKDQNPTISSQLCLTELSLPRRSPNVCTFTSAREMTCFRKGTCKTGMGVSNSIPRNHTKTQTIYISVMRRWIRADCWDLMISPLCPINEPQSLVTNPIANPRKSGMRGPLA